MDKSKNIDINCYFFFFCDTPEKLQENTRAVTLSFCFLKQGKSSCFLETKYISDVTSKIVSRNSLNEETNKQEIKSTSKRSLYVPYLKKVNTFYAIR